MATLLANPAAIAALFGLEMDYDAEPVPGAFTIKVIDPHRTLSSVDEVVGVVAIYYPGDLYPTDASGAPVPLCRLGWRKLEQS